MEAFHGDATPLTLRLRAPGSSPGWSIVCTTRSRSGWGKAFSNLWALYAPLLSILSESNEQFIEKRGQVVQQQALSLGLCPRSLLISDQYEGLGKC